MTRMELVIFQLRQNMKLLNFVNYKFGCSILALSFGTTFNFVSELYPTHLRGCGLGFGSAMARVGEILVPQIIFLKHIHPILPPLIIGSFCLIGATTRSELLIDISDKGDVKGEDNLGPYQGHYIFSPKSPYTLEDHNVLFF